MEPIDKKDEQQIKEGDFVVIREKNWNDDTKWDARTPYIYRVLSVDEEKVVCKNDYSDNPFTENICNCVKIPEEEVNRYCEIKGSKSRVQGLVFSDPKRLSESQKNIKIGDIIRVNFSGDCKSWEKYYYKYDYIVLGTTDALIACTRLNRNQDLYVFPRENCFIKGEEPDAKPELIFTSDDSQDDIILLDEEDDYGI